MPSKESLDIAERFAPMPPDRTERLARSIDELRVRDLEQAARWTCVWCRHPEPGDKLESIKGLLMHLHKAGRYQGVEHPPQSEGTEMSKPEDNRPFPIQGGYPPAEKRRAADGSIIRHEPCAIPWWLAEIAYEHYHAMYGGQTLERIAERGGFGREELVSLIRRVS